MNNLNKYLQGYFRALVPVSTALLFMTAALKLTGPLAVKFGLIDRALARLVPEPMLYGAAAVEFAAVFLLTRDWLSLGCKLQLLFLLSTTFISFRILAFGSLFAPDCGCLGPLTLLTEHVGRGLEGLLVVFLAGAFLGYPLQVISETIQEDQGLSTQT